MSVPLAVVQAAISQVVEEARQKVKQQEPTHDVPQFLPSTHFEGKKKGYVFTTRTEGTGYYLDPHQIKEGGLPDRPDGLQQQEQQAPEELDPQQLLKEAEEQANIEEIQLLDARSLRRLLTSFERKQKDNMELRLKYEGQPEKYLDSEVDLAELIRSIMQVASTPDLYPILIEGTAVRTLVNLLTHENNDIKALVIELFMELTDADAVEDAREEAKALVEALLEQHVLELVVQEMTKFDESSPEEASAVYNSLSTLENLAAVEPSVAEQVLDKTQLLKWILRRIRVKETDSNKQYACEVLAVLCQGSEANQQKVGEVNGIDTILQCLAPYKNRDPQTAEEEEFIENAFDLLCSCLMVPDNQTLFVKAEGVELMVIILRGRGKFAKYGAIKALDFATTRCPAACERFIDQLGLKVAFSLFMGKTRVKVGRGDSRELQAELEERLISIIGNLFHGLPSKGTRRDRLASKFVENEFEKCDRLMELYFRYEVSVESEETRLMEELEEEGDEVREEEILLARLSAGLYPLQQCCVILGNLWLTGDPGLCKRILMLLHQKGRSLENLRTYLKEYYRTIGTDGGVQEQQKQRQRIQQILLSLGVDMEEEDKKAEELREQLQNKDHQQDGTKPSGSPPPPLPPPEGEEVGAIPEVEMAVEDEHPQVNGGVPSHGQEVARKSATIKEPVDGGQRKGLAGRPVAEESDEDDRERSRKREPERSEKGSKRRASPVGSDSSEDEERHHRHRRGRDHGREDEGDKGRARAKERHRERDRDRDSRRDRPDREEEYGDRGHDRADKHKRSRRDHEHERRDKKKEKRRRDRSQSVD